MPEAQAEQDPATKPPEKRLNCIGIINSFIAGATAVILFVTLLYVKNYAEEAHNQSASLATSIAQQGMVNRPVVIANGVGIQEKDARGTPTKVGVNTVNFGKTTAEVVTTVGHIFAVNNGALAPFDPECDENGLWPKGNTVHLRTKTCYTSHTSALHTGRIWHGENGSNSG
jgi:hypothetical protein